MQILFLKSSQALVLYATIIVTYEYVSLGKYIFTYYITLTKCIPSEGFVN